jgi:YbbR domain-containing protein
VVGPEHLVSKLDAVETEEVDLRGVRENRIIEVKLVAPAPQVRILNDAPIYLRVMVGPR